MGLVGLVGLVKKPNAFFGKTGIKHKVVGLRKRSRHETSLKTNANRRGSLARL